MGRSGELMFSFKLPNTSRKHTCDQSDQNMTSKPSVEKQYNYASSPGRTNQPVNFTGEKGVMWMTSSFQNRPTLWASSWPECLFFIFRAIQKGQPMHKPFEATDSGGSGWIMLLSEFSSAGPMLGWMQRVCTPAGLSCGCHTQLKGSASSWRGSGRTAIYQQPGSRRVHPARREVASHSVVRLRMFNVTTRLEGPSVTCIGFTLRKPMHHSREHRLLSGQSSCCAAISPPLPRYKRLWALPVCLRTWRAVKTLHCHMTGEAGGGGSIVTTKLLQYCPIIFEQKRG